MGSKNDVKNVVAWLFLELLSGDQQLTYYQPPHKPWSSSLRQINLVKGQSAFTDHNTL